MLSRSLALVNRLLSRPGAVFAFGAGTDPMQINLPPLGAGGGVGGGGLSAEALHVLASLYFQAEMEQAAVIPLAELLTESRYSLQLTDHAAAQLLEQFAEGMQGRWLKRKIRDQIFARTFGTGSAVLSEPGTAINRNFETLLARYCQSLAQYQADSRWSAPGAGQIVQAEFAAQQLTANLAQRQFGNTLTAAQRMQGQLQAALDLLNHPGVTRLFQANSIWGLIRNVLESDAPDLQRIITRAQSGLRLLSWLADHLPQLQARQFGQALAAGGEVFIWAVNWLQATGMPDPGQQPAQSPTWPGSPPGGIHSGVGGVFSATAMLRNALAADDREYAA